MGDVVNLRGARKMKARAAADAKAQANRIAFGRTKAEKRHTEAQRNAAERNLDGHKRDDGTDDHN